MKKIVMYSNQIPGLCRNVDDALLRLIGKENAKVAYIPSCSDITRRYFGEAVKYYKELGISDLFYFDLDIEYNENLRDELMNCDVLPPDRCNTWNFVKNINKRGFEKDIISFVEAGGVLVGVSAGAILMSDTIDIASLLDVKEESDMRKKGLGLIRFEFYPHWKDNCYAIEQIKDYSISSKKSIYLCSDGNGIAISDDNIELIGINHIISYGKQISFF